MSESTTPDVIVCAGCGKPIAHEAAETNATGQPVHSECHLEQLREQQIDPLKAESFRLIKMNVGVGSIEIKLSPLVLRPHDCVIECPSGFLAGKIPLDHDLIAIRATVPSSRFPPQRGAISDPAATQALPGVQADGDLCLVQPTAMLRGVVHREPLPQP